MIKKLLNYKTLRIIAIFSIVSIAAIMLVSHLSSESWLFYGEYDEALLVPFWTFVASVGVILLKWFALDIISRWKNGKKRSAILFTVFYLFIFTVIGATIGLGMFMLAWSGWTS